MDLDDVMIGKSYASLLPEIAKQGPIIHQLETVTARISGSETDRQMRELLQQLHWEFIWLDILSKWVSGNYLPALFMESGEINSWLHGGDITAKFAHQRYTQTAEQYGFKPLEAGLMGLYFAYNQDSDGDQAAT